MRISSLETNERLAVIRGLQAFCYRLFSSNNVSGPIHFAFGHEWVAYILLKSTFRLDNIFLPHRNIHFQLADLVIGNHFDAQGFRDFVNEICLKSNKPYESNIGAMNYVKPGVVTYTSSILANQLGFACGAALFSKVTSRKPVLAVLGDGAIEEGRFWESLILSSGKQLPIAFLVENNSWSMQSSISERRASLSLKDLAKAFHLDWVEISPETPSLNLNLNLKRPLIIECNLNTLGGASVNENRSKRYVNYHSGKFVGDCAATKLTDFYEMNDKDIITTSNLTNRSVKVISEILAPHVNEFGLTGFL